MDQQATDTHGLPTIEPALFDVRAYRNQTVYEGSRPLTTGLAAIYFCFIILGLIDLPEGDVANIINDLVSMLVMLALRTVLVRRWLPLEAGNGVLALMAVLAFANTLVTFLVRLSPSELSYLPFFAVGSGFFLLSWSWFAITIAVMSTCWLLVVPLFLTGDLVLYHGLTFATGAALGAMVHTAHMRTHSRLVEYRRRDAEQKAALEQELAERRRAEAERAELEVQLAHAQKMEAVGALAGGVAHDMNNVLAAITGLASVLREEAERGSPLREDLGTILRAARRGSALTHNLLGFARRGKYRREQISFNEVAGQILALLERTISKKIDVERDLADDLWSVEGDRAQLGQVVMNLCINAADAMPEGGTMQVVSRNLDRLPPDLGVLEDLRDGRYVCLEVIDNGVGMDPATQQRVFEPFFTTKDAGQGTGLGLAMVYGTIRNHGGTARLQSAPGQGTTVSIYLPSKGARARVMTPSMLRGARPGSGTILVIDDEPMVRRAAQRTLGQLGFEVLLAESGAQGIELYREHQQEIDLVLLDMGMPGMDGRTCFGELRRVDPGVRVLICSGYAKDADMEYLLGQGALGLVGKPFDLEQLAKQLADALEDQGPSDSFP